MTAPVHIADVVPILTRPGGINLVVIKVITSEPGLHGVGCATFTQRFRAVHAAIEQHLKPFLIGRDQALWDIKGKRAGMPVYQLLGGKCREAAIDSVRQLQAEGYRHIRVQLGGYGGVESEIPRPDGALSGAYFNPRAYVRAHLGLFEAVRDAVGDEVELLHDILERLTPIDAVGFAKDMECFKLFFLEDPLAPEDLDWFRNIRQQCATPIAMGELFNQPARVAAFDRR